MDITPPVSLSTNIINSYSSKGIKINNQLVDYDLLVSGSILEKWHNKDGILAISSYLQIINQLKQFDKNNMPILLIGTGEESLLLTQNISNQLMQHAIYPEIMTSKAACRTFNVLISEGRNVFAALINMKK